MNLLKLNLFSLRSGVWAVVIWALTGNVAAAVAANSKIQKMRDGATQSSNDIFELGAKIRTLEKKLGNKNEEYLTQLEEIKKIDLFIGKIRKKIRENGELLTKETERITDAYEQMLLNDLRPQGEEYLLKRKLLEQILVAESSHLQKIDMKNRKLLKLLDNYENDLFALKENEKSIYDVIVNMENEKKNLSKTYLDKLAVKNEMDQKLEIEIARKKAYRPRPKAASGSIGKGMQLPLTGYTHLKESKKGVTFKYSGVQPIQATASGKVVYLGELAAYGNVIIIDHGQDIRSVILGDFRSRAQKGDHVTQGELIGHTNLDQGMSKSLYYEIRKSNVAQDTLSILKSNKVL